MPRTGLLDVLPAASQPIDVRVRRADGGWTPGRARRLGGVVVAALLDDQPALGPLVHHGNDMVTVLDPEDGHVRYLSPSVAEQLGWTPPDLAEGRGLELVHEDDRADLGRRIAFVWPTPGAHAHAVCRLLRLADGAWRTIDLHLANLTHLPAVEGIVLDGRDITDTLAAQAELARLASVDPGTGLVNRRRLLELLTELLLDVSPARPLAVLFVDLDRFKAVNDTFGHQAGDRVLGEVAERLRRAVRAQDVVARLGGDEFVVALPATDQATAVSVADRLLELLATPFRLSGAASSQIGASIGVVVVDQPAAAESILGQADRAMYAAKARGRGRAQLWNEPASDVRGAPAGLARQLMHAMEDDQLELHWQPEVELATGRVIGAEALLRWRHGELGLLEASRFVQLAGDLGLLALFSTYALDLACRAAARWPLPLTVRVNLAAEQLAGGRLSSYVEDVCRRSGLAPARLCFELTERAPYDTGGAVREDLDALRALGVRLELDDIAAGWSTLAHLRELPLTGLKLDARFVQGLGRDRRDEAIVAGLCRIAADLGLAVGAEGVETAAQRDELVARGVRTGQGFLFSPVLSPATLADQLARLASMHA